MDERQHLYIGGAWQPSTEPGTVDVVDASTEEVIGRVPLGSADDVDRAVQAARRALEDWSTTTPAARRAHLAAMADQLAARADEIAALIASEVGMPIRLAKAIQAGLPARNAAAHVDLIEAYAFEQELGNSLIVREPIGVVAAITPWNYPLHQLVAKVAPALAAGCTVVAKPSEVAPLSAFLLADLLAEIGLPDGVFNLVSGTGPVVGEALATHPGVDMVSFTGSTAAGRRVSALASSTVKRVALELGGKSANVLLDDADLERCVPPGVQHGCFLNSGQTCSALTRMVVPRSLQDRVVELAVAKAESLTLGPPDSGADLGPLVSDVQRERVRGYIRSGIDEGAALVAGGVEPPDGLERGYYVRPTVFADVTSDMTIAREEIFGPVLCIMPYDSEDDAVRIANDTSYGLAGAVQSADPDRAMAVARRLRTGQVDVNGGAFNIGAPFGGYRQSGNGRELGTFGIDEYVELKAIQRPR